MQEKIEAWNRRDFSAPLSEDELAMLIDLLKQGPDLTAQLSENGQCRQKLQELIENSENQIGGFRALCETVQQSLYEPTLESDKKSEMLRTLVENLGNYVSHLRKVQGTFQAEIICHSLCELLGGTLGDTGKLFGPAISMLFDSLNSFRPEAPLCFSALRDLAEDNNNLIPSYKFFNLMKDLIKNFAANKMEADKWFELVLTLITDKKQNEISLKLLKVKDLLNNLGVIKLELVEQYEILLVLIENPKIFGANDGANDLSKLSLISSLVKDNPEEIKQEKQFNVLKRVKEILELQVLKEPWENLTLNNFIDENGNRLIKKDNISIEKLAELIHSNYLFQWLYFSLPTQIEGLCSTNTFYLLRQLLRDGHFQVALNLLNDSKLSVSFDVEGDKAVSLNWATAIGRISDMQKKRLGDFGKHDETLCVEIVDRLLRLASKTDLASDDNPEENYVDKVSLINFKKTTPLHFAVKAESLKMVKKLVEYGAKTDVLDSDKRTPLWRAAMRGNHDTFVYLFEKGAPRTDNFPLDSHRKPVLIDPGPELLPPPRRLHECF